MSSDSFNLKLPFLSLGIKKQDRQIKLNEGDAILLRYWSWKKFGYIRKAYRLQDGKVIVQRLD